jgi:hypothetical protein
MRASFRFDARMAFPFRSTAYNKHEEETMTVKEQLRDMIEDLPETEAERLLESLKAKRREEAASRLLAEVEKWLEKPFVPPSPERLQKILDDLAERTPPDAPADFDISRESFYE